MSYQVTLVPVAVKQIKNLAPNIQPLLTLKLQELGLNPRPDGAVKLESTETLYQIRMGEYRIVYQIQDEPLIITVVKVAHPREY